MLHDIGVACTTVGKSEQDEMSASYVIDEGLVDLVINVPLGYDSYGRPDGYLIRRRAIEADIPLITDRQLARALVEALRNRKPGSLRVVAWNDYLSTRSPVRML